MPIFAPCWTCGNTAHLRRSYRTCIGSSLWLACSECEDKRLKENDRALREAKKQNPW